MLGFGVLRLILLGFLIRVWIPLCLHFCSRERGKAILVLEQAHIITIEVKCKHEF